VIVGSLQIRLFGGLELSAEGTRLPLPASRRAQALLAYLVLHPGPCRRAKLIGELFPESSEKRGRKQLSQELWKLNSLLDGHLPEGQLIIQRSETVELSPSTRVWIDTVEFDRAYQDWREAKPGSPEEFAALETAASLYTGELLAGFYDDWLQTAQSSARDLALQVFDRLVELLTARGEYVSALGWARRLIDLDPLTESSHRRLIRVELLLGRPTRALKALEQCRELLELELDAPLSAATEALREDIERVRADRSRPPLPRTDERHHRLVGRGEERSVLSEALDSLIEGSPFAVLLTGPPGMGRTSLIESLALDARWRGVTLAPATCRPGADAPLQPLLEAARAIVTPLPAWQLENRLDHHQLVRLEPFIPHLNAGGSQADRSAPESTSELTSALGALFECLAEDRPLMIVVDDFHLADPASRRLVLDLARLAAGGRLGLLVSWEEGATRSDPDLWNHLRQIDRLTGTRRVELGPLTRPDITRLITSTPGVPADDCVATRVAELTGGNPRQILRLLSRLSEAEAEGGPGPDLEVLALELGIPERLISRLEGLGARALLILRVLAVATSPIPVTALDRLPREDGAGTTEMISAITDLLDRQIVAEDRGHLSVASHLLARSVTAGLDPVELKRIHSLVAELLDATGAPSEVVAEHLSLADEPVAAWDRWHRALTEAVAQGHPTLVHDIAPALLSVGDMGRVPSDLAARTLLAAHQLAEIVGDVDLQSALVERAGELGPVSGAVEVDRSARLIRTLGHRAAWSEAESEAAAALERLDPGEVPGGRAELLLALGTTRTLAARLGEALEALDGATRSAPDSLTRARAHAAMANSAWLTPAVTAEGTALMTQILETSGERLAPHLQIEFHRALAVTRFRGGDSALSPVHMNRAVELAERIGALPVASATRAARATGLLITGRLGEALMELTESAEVVSQLPARRQTAEVQLSLASAAAQAIGDIQLVEHHGRAALSYFESTGNPVWTAMTLDPLMTIALWTGDPDGAEAMMERQSELWSGAGIGPMPDFMIITRSRVPAARGDFERALDEISACSPRPVGYRVRVELYRARLLFAAGRIDEAARIAERVSDSLAHGLLLPELYHLKGLLHRHRGDLNSWRQAWDHGYRLLSLSLQPLDPDVILDAGPPWSLDLLAHHREHRSISVVARLRPSPGVVPSASEVEFVEVDWTVAHSGDLAYPEGSERRRQRILRLVEEARAAGALPSTTDLAIALGASTATIKRDLIFLRERGHLVDTHGMEPRRPLDKQ